MIKRLNAILALLLVSVTLTGVLCIPASADQQLRVTASWLRLRSGPGVSDIHDFAATKTKWLPPRQSSQ